MEKTKKELDYLKTIRRLVGEKARIQNTSGRKDRLVSNLVEQGDIYKNNWRKAENKITDMKSAHDKEIKKLECKLYAKDIQIEEMQKAMGELWNRYQTEVEKNIALKTAYRLATSGS